METPLNYIKQTKYYEEKDIVIYNANCLEIMPELEKANIIITDPPYGINKAEWDEKYPKELESFYLNCADTIAIMCGQWAIPLCISELKESYLGIIALHNRNGMTFSPLGFGNWIPVIIAGKRPKSGQDCLSFNVTSYKPNHPTPKPINAIKKLVLRLSEPNDLILDPFLGSGTTLCACKELGRRDIGIEISETYCKIAVQRLKNTQRDMFLCAQ